MKLFIKTKKLKSPETGYIAEVVWGKGDGGKVGTPGAVKYGDTAQEAKSRLKMFLEGRGATVN